MTYTLGYDAENHLVSVSGPSLSAAFTYDGDGRRVKSEMNNETILFIGGHYEFNDTTNQVTKYYFAGATRIAVRKYIIPQTTTLTYLLGDHLGSTSLAVDADSGAVVETRYKPWGEVRYTTPDKTLPTQYTFTGQFSYVSDEATDLATSGSFGLMFYNARWYDPALGRFAQADTIVPGGVQGYDRYAYVNNGPVRYVDPSGHCSQTGDDWCFEENGNHQDKPRDDLGGECSVSSGSFNGSFSCTPDDLNGATIEQRQGWFNGMLASVNPGLVQEFVNINTILSVFIATDNGAPGTWTSWGDAGILNSIQNGLSLFKNGDAPGMISSPYSTRAADAWLDYFTSFKKTGAGNNETLQKWGTAEGLSTTYGRLLAQEHGQQKSNGEMLFLLVGDGYRTLLAHRLGPESTTDWPGVVAGPYNSFLDTGTTMWGTNASPVGLVAYPLLLWK